MSKEKTPWLYCEECNALTMRSEERNEQVCYRCGHRQPRVLTAIVPSGISKLVISGSPVSDVEKGSTSPRPERHGILEPEKFCKTTTTDAEWIYDDRV